MGMESMGASKTEAAQHGVLMMIIGTMIMVCISMVN